MPMPPTTNRIFKRRFTRLLKETREDLESIPNFNCLATAEHNVGHHVHLSISETLLLEAINDYISVRETIYAASTDAHESHGCDTAAPIGRLLDD